MDIVLFTEDMENHIDSRTFVSKFFFRSEDPTDCFDGSIVSQNHGCV